MQLSGMPICAISRIRIYGFGGLNSAGNNFMQGLVILIEDALDVKKIVKTLDFE
jgi:hypothetical protein